MSRPRAIRWSGCGSRATPVMTATNAPTCWRIAAWKKLYQGAEVRQIILDTETTGLDPNQGHRIIEVAGVEMVNRQLTGNHFHRYINPEREIDLGAQQVHGLSLEFLQDKPRFCDIADELLEYLRGAELVIHNAPFDVGFLNR